MVVKDIRKRTVLERQSLNLWLKACSRDAGDVVRERDVYGWYFRCLQCGWYYDATQRGTSGFWELEDYARHLFAANPISSTGNYVLTFSGN